MIASQWFVTADHTPVSWGTAVVDDVATTDIYRITLSDGATPKALRLLWARTGQAVTVGAVARATDAASQDPVPALPVPQTHPAARGHVLRSTTLEYVEKVTAVEHADLAGTPDDDVTLYTVIG